MNINRETLRLYWAQIQKYKPSFFTALISIPLGELLISTLLPYFLSIAIGGLASGYQPTVQQSLVWAAIFGLSGAALNYIGFQALTRHEANVRKANTDTSFASLIRKDVNFFTNTKVGALTTRHIDFIRSHVALQDLLIIRTLGFILSITIGLTLLFAASPSVAGMLLFLLIALIIQIRWSIKKRAPWRHERKEIIGKMHGHVADSITNYLIVKTFAGEDRETRTLEDHSTRFRNIFNKDIGFIATEGSARVMLMVVIQLIAVGYASWLVFNNQLTVATAIFVLAYLQRISTSLFSMGDMLNGYDQALLDAQPLTEMLLRKDKVTDKPSAKTIDKLTPSIVLNNVRFRYEDDKADVLQGVSLTIPAGQKVGLVGHSGAGKSTIVSLLLRFADVTDGDIALGGYDINTLTQQSLRKHIAYVPQEPMLFHRSLRENIAYGKPDATDEEITHAAKQANALEFIKALPNSFDTLVGERGVKLSGGQRQRIAIARAILKDAPILVLDEATSALDSESEKLIQASLDELMKGRTSIVIAHRLSTIAKLDRIIVLDNGKIVEDGTHAELQKAGGIYANLWSHQSGGFIED